MSLIDRFLNLPDADAIAQSKEAQATFFKQSLFLTAKCLLGYKDLSRRTHKMVCDALTADTKRKLIVMPRGTFKSSLCSVSFPIWSLINNPDIRILLDSELYSNSKNFLREIKLHLEKPKLVELFGPFKGFTWNEGEIIINQRTKVYKEASITCSGLGAEKTGQHYDLIVMDDLNSPSNSNTSEGCHKVVDHYRYAQAVLEPGGAIVFVGTRYSAGDCIQHILDNEVFIREEEHDSTQAEFSHGQG